MYQNSELLEIIMKKHKIQENKKIRYNELQQISHEEKIEMKDLIFLLQISSSTINKLKKEKQKYTKLKFNKYQTTNFKDIISEGKISKEKFIMLKTEYKLKNYTLMRLLGISEYGYNKVKNGEKNEMSVTDIKIKHTVESVKLDFKYIKKYHQGYYSKEKLKDICKNRKISLDEFIKYYNKNPKHYKLNKLAITKSKKGLWIGENIRIPDEFLNKYYEKITRLLRKVSKLYDQTNGWQIYKEDIIQETILNIYERCGEIVKKFYFDIELTINILIVKGKYIMYNLYKSKYRNNNIYYDGYDSKLLDHTSFLSDNRYNPQTY